MSHFLELDRINSQIFKICLLSSLIGLLSYNIGPARSQSSPEKLQTKISTLIGADKDNVSVMVEQLGSNGPVVSINGTKPLNPASVMKLVTTKVAIDVLGLDFRWSTQVRRTGKIGGRSNKQAPWQEEEAAAGSRSFSSASSAASYFPLSAGRQSSPRNAG